MEKENEMMSGFVYVRKERVSWLHKKRYVVALSKGGSNPIEGSQARLIVYKCKSHNMEVLQQINFGVVLGIYGGPSGLTLKLPDQDFKFRSKRSSVNKQWLEVCWLLNAIPNHPVPKPPDADRSQLRPELAELSKQYCELYSAYDAWAVQILPSSIAISLKATGPRIITISKEGTLNIIFPSSDGTQTKFAKNEIRRCGLWKSMVFVEIGSMATGGAKGMIWMDCFKDRVKEIRDKIHNFLFYGPEASLPSMYCPNFLADMPFSPRCLFSQPTPYRSRSTSVSSAESSSPPLPAPKPFVNLSTHPAIKNLIETSSSGLKGGRASSQRVERRSLSLKPEYEDDYEIARRRKRKSILLAEGYSTPVSHSSATRTASDPAPGIVPDLASRKPAEDTCALPDYLKLHS